MVLLAGDFLRREITMSQIASQRLAVNTKLQDMTSRRFRITTDGVAEFPFLRHAVITTNGNLRRPLRMRIRHHRGFARSGFLVIDKLHPVAFLMQLETSAREMIPTIVGQAFQPFRRIAARRLKVRPFKTFEQSFAVVAICSAFADVADIILFAQRIEFNRQFFRGFRQILQIILARVAFPNARRRIGLQDSKIKAKTFTANTFRKNWIILHSVFRQFVQRQRVVKTFKRQPSCNTAVIAAKIVLGFFNPVAQEINVLQQERSRRAIIAVEIFAHERFFVLVRIPQKMRNQPCTWADKIADVARDVALFKHADGMMVGEETKVGSQSTPVRLWQHVVREVRDVVPNVEVRRHGTPIFDVFTETLVGRPRLQRLREIHFDTAKTDDDVLGRFRDFWCRACISVCQRLNEKFRIFLFNLLCDGVHKANQRARLAAFYLLYFQALRAFATTMPVVLRNGNHAGRRLLANLFQADSREFLCHLFVRQAELRPVRRTLSPLHGIPFRMIFEILFRRQELEERMAPADDGHVAAPIIGNLLMMTVGFQTRCPCGIDGMAVERFTTDNLRRIHIFLCINDKRRFLRNVAFRRCPPADAYIVLQKRIDGIQRATRHAAVQIDVAVFETNGRRVRFRLREIDLWERGLACFADNEGGLAFWTFRRFINSIICSSHLF